LGPRRTTSSAEPEGSHVVEEGVSFGMPPHRGHIGVEQEARAHVGSAAHHQQRRTGGQSSNRVNLFARHSPVERCQLRGELIAVVHRRVVVGPPSRRTARRHIIGGVTQIPGINHRDPP